MAGTQFLILLGQLLIGLNQILNVLGPLVLFELGQDLLDRVAGLLVALLLGLLLRVHLLHSVGDLDHRALQLVQLLHKQLLEPQQGLVLARQLRVQVRKVQLVLLRCAGEHRGEFLGCELELGVFARGQLLLLGQLHLRVFVFELRQLLRLGGGQLRPQILHQLVLAPQFEQRHLVLTLELAHSFLELLFLSFQLLHFVGVGLFEFRDQLLQLLLFVLQVLHVLQKEGQLLQLG